MLWRTIYMRITSAAKAPNAIPGVDSDHLPAPACIFSNGLPLPLAGGGSVSSDPDADDVCVKEAPGVGTGAEGWAEGLGDEMVDTGALPATVDVTMLPVLICVGPMTMGTIICSVLPSPSVEVFVMVVLIALVKSAPASSCSSVWVVVVGGLGAAGAGLVVGAACVGFGGSAAAVLDTAA